MNFSFSNSKNLHYQIFFLPCKLHKIIGSQFIVEKKKIYVTLSCSFLFRVRKTFALFCCRLHKSFLIKFLLKFFHVFLSGNIKKVFDLLMKDFRKPRTLRFSSQFLLQRTLSLKL